MKLKAYCTTVFLVVVVAAADCRWLYRECGNSFVSGCQAPEIKHARSAGCTTTPRFVLFWHLNCHRYFNWRIMLFCFCVWICFWHNHFDDILFWNGKHQFSLEGLCTPWKTLTWREFGAWNSFCLKVGFGSWGTYLVLVAQGRAVIWDGALILMLYLDILEVLERQTVNLFESALTYSILT